MAARFLRNFIYVASRRAWPHFPFLITRVTPSPSLLRLNYDTEDLLLFFPRLSFRTGAPFP